MRISCALLLIAGTAAAQPVAQPDSVTWDEARFDARGTLLHLRTHDPQLVTGAFDDDAAFEWAGVLGINRATIGLEVLDGQRVMTARVLGFVLADMTNEPRPAGLAVVTRTGKSVDVDIRYARLAPETVRTRVVGAAYVVVASYGQPVPLDAHERHPKIERTTRKALRLADEQVFASSALVMLHGAPRLVVCVEADAQPDAIDGLQVYASHLEPLGKAPALPLLVDAVTGETLKLHPARCVFDPDVP